MSRPNPILYGLFLCAVIASVTGLYLAKGGLYLIAHEIDTYHLIDILMRMQMGLVPHVDFVTPLGTLGFLPFLTFIDAGQTMGRAFVLGQALVATVLAPAIWYAGMTRLRGRNAYLFAAVTLGLVLALGWGGATSKPSVSMFYNRWSWAMAFVAIALALLPATGARRDGVDGVVLGLLAAALAFTKATYVIALAPGLAVALLFRGAWRTMAVAGGVSVAVLALVTLFAGPDFVLGYASDLMNVARSDLRPSAGVPYLEIVSGPANIAITLVGLAAVLVLNRLGHVGPAVALVVLLPGFAYITYQNFGNDPEWLLALVLLLMALRPEAGEKTAYGRDGNGVVTALAVVAFVLFLPSAFRLASSPLQHYGFRAADFVPMLPALPEHGDIHVRSDRSATMQAIVDLAERPGGWSVFRTASDASLDPEHQPRQSLAGTDFPVCEIQAGTTAWLTEVTRALAALGVPEGSTVFATDILSAFWLFGHLAPLEAGAPWYYGDLTGLDRADYVLVPKCPYSQRVRGVMLSELNASGRTFELVSDNDLFAIFSVR